jgi:hypothetical protein
MALLAIKFLGDDTHDHEKAKNGVRDERLSAELRILDP